MLATSLLAIVAMLVGGIVGLVRLSEVVLGPLRVFAVVSVSAIVLLQLLPEAILAGGPIVLLPAAAAFALPGLWPRLRRARPSSGPPRRVTLEVAYLSLLVHKVSDGLGLGAVIAHDHGLDGHWELALALFAHTVPMAAVVAMTFRGRGHVQLGLRLAGLALAMIAGAFVSDTVAHGPWAGIRPYFDAMAAGLLLHIVFHDLPRPNVRGLRIRLLELLSLGAGLAVALLGLHGHGDHGHPGHTETDVIHALSDVALTFAPALVLGLLLAAALRTALSRDTPAPSRSPILAALRGAFAGAHFPVCSCASVATAGALEQRRSPLPALVAFLIAAPELQPDTVLMTAQGLGWPLAIARALSALTLAILGGLLASRLSASRVTPPTTPKLAPFKPSKLSPQASLRIRAADMTPSCDHDALLSAPDGHAATRFVRVLLGLVEHSGPWLLVSLLVASYFEAMLPSAAFTHLPTGLALLVILALAIPTSVCASASTPVALVLVGKGLAPGLALAGLLIGPMTNRPTLAYLRRHLGAPRALALIVGLGLAITTLTLGADLAFDPANARLPDGVHVVSVALLSLLGLASLWRVGVARWLEALHGHHDHDHPHPHRHDALDAMQSTPGQSPSVNPATRA
jgi:hypothetical protein